MGIITGIRKKFKSISRYNQILKILLKYGFEDLVHYLEENKRYTFIQKLIPNSTKKQVAQYSKWAKMRLVCEELGPTFVKFGQILSNRPDLVPLELTFELVKLQDSVPPMPEKAAKLVGMVSLVDFMYNISGAGLSDDHKIYKTLKVKDIMTSKPFYLNTISTVEDVAKVLALGKYHAIPILENDRLVGIVSTADIINYYLNKTS